MLPQATKIARPQVLRLARTLALCSATLMLTAAAVSPAPAQRLAQRNWQGSGLTVQVWWTRAVFCRLDLRTGEAGDLKAVTAQLDTLASIGCDALELGLLTPSGPANLPVPAAYGTVQDADDLIGEVGRHKLRLVLDLPLGNTPEQVLLDRTRFWLARGVAGFVLEDDNPSATLLHRLRQLTQASLGTRVLIGSPSGPAAAHRSPPADLQLVRRPIPGLAPSTPDQAAHLRAQLTAILSDSSSTLLAGSPASDPATLPIQASILLASGAAVSIDISPLSLLPAASTPGQPTASTAATPSSLADWFRILIALHHANIALRTGSATFLDRDAENVLSWLVRPRSSGTPLLVACNLSAHPVRVDASSQMRALGIRGTYLRTLLRTDAVRQPATLETIDLPPGGVFLGEIR